MRSRSTSTRPAAASSRLAAPSSASTWSGAPPGILEISAWNQANALRQVTVKRGLDVRDFTLATFGGSGSLLACRLVDILGARGRRRAAEPGQPVGVRAAHRRRQERLRADRRQPRHAELDHAAGRRRSSTSCTARAAAALDARGLRRPRAAGTCAPPTCATSARPTRCGCRCPTGRSTPAWRETAWPTLPRRAPALYGYDFRDDPRQQVEWVNLRVTGVGPITPARAARDRCPATSEPSTGAHDRRPGRSASTGAGYDATDLLAPGPARRRRGLGPGGGRGVRRPRCRCHPGFSRDRRPLRQPA